MKSFRPCRKKTAFFLSGVTFWGRTFFDEVPLLYHLQTLSERKYFGCSMKRILQGCQKCNIGFEITSLTETRILIFFSFQIMILSNNVFACGARFFEKVVKTAFYVFRAIFWGNGFLEKDQCLLSLGIKQKSFVFFNIYFLAGLSKQHSTYPDEQKVRETHFYRSFLYSDNEL